MIRESSLKDALKEYFYAGFCSDPIKERLISRYWDKCSKRLHEEHAELMADGKIHCAEVMADLCARPNPLLKLLPKEDAFVGKYYPIPVIYGGDK